jgi:hypothetical protein
MVYDGLKDKEHALRICKNKEVYFSIHHKDISS